MDSRPQGGHRPRYSSNYNGRGFNNNNNNNNDSYRGRHPRSGGDDVNNSRPSRGPGRGRGSYNSDRSSHREVHFQGNSRGRGQFSNDRGSRARPRGMFNRNNRQRDVQAQPADLWFEVDIPHGETDGKDSLFRSLNASLDTPINPINYRLEGNIVRFNVEGQDTADTLRNLNRRITKSDGYKISINIKPCSPPASTVDPATTELIKQVMARRFQADYNLLDLSKFRKDEEFLKKELYISLDRLNVIQAVVKIIQENIPALASLNVSDNKIKFLKGLAPLKDVCTGLKALNLSKNSISSLTELGNLDGLNLEELSIIDNPAAKVKDASSLISIVRKTFPQLKKLNGEALPATIGFDIGEAVTDTPQTLGNCVPANVEEVLKSFLHRYYTTFDSEDRRPLMDLYHDQAVFSYSCFNTTNFSRELINDSRNLLRLPSEHPELRRKLLKQGNLNIVASLSSFPKTNHIEDSLILDVPFSSSELITLVVTGLFNEPNVQRQKTTRAFSRTFNLVPDNRVGCQIINDVWVISNSSYNQRQKARGLTSHSSTGSMNDEFMSAETSSSGDSLNPMSREEPLVKKLSHVTGMNENFSRQCLSEVQFNYERAYQVFLQLNEIGSIPPEAFS